MTDKVYGKVSVIIPVYNGQNYIQRCVNSVYSQTYKNVELIIINDGSTDHSDDVIKSICLKHNEIVYIKLDVNAGLSNARNIGIENTTGDWLMFLDADDTIESGMIEDILAMSIKKDAELALCSFCRIVNNKKIPQNEKIASGVYTRKEFFIGLFDKFSLSWLSCIGTKLYKTNSIKKTGIRFSDKYKYNEDLGFVLDVLLKIDNVLVINKEYYCYYATPGSVQHKGRYREGSLETIINTRRKLERMLKSEKLWNEKKVAFSSSLIDVFFGNLLCQWDSYKNFVSKYLIVSKYKKYIKTGIQRTNVAKRIFSIFVLWDYKEALFIYINILDGIKRKKQSINLTGERRSKCLL